VELVSATAFCALAYFGSTALWPIYAIAAAFGAARAFFSPASAALGPTLVPRNLLPRAIAMNSLSWQLASVIGPAIGGLLVAASAVMAFGVAGVLFAAALLLLFCFASPVQIGARGASRLALIKEGLVYLWTNKFVLGAISLDLFAVLLGGATALLPVFAKDILHVGPTGLGFLEAALPVGSLGCALVLAHRRPLQEAGQTLLWAVGLFGWPTFLFGLSHWYWFSFCMLVVCGAADNVSVVVRHTLVQLLTPDEKRGRVSAVNSLFIGTSNELGGFESGFVAQLLSPVISVVSGGIGTLLVVLAVGWVWPEIRKYGRLDAS